MIAFAQQIAIIKTIEVKIFASTWSKEQTMSLSEQEKTIVATTISGYISNISVESPENFSPLICALRSLLEPDLDAEMDTSLRDSITTISDYMEPWFGAVAPQNRDEFIALCKGVILNRIHFFEHLSSDDKLNYIDNQAIYRQQVTENQTLMSRASPPEAGSEAHVVSEQAMLREMQARFINTIGAMTTEELVARAWLLFRDRPTPLTRQTFFLPEPPRRSEPLEFGCWTRTTDTWEHGYDATPHNASNHLNRKRHYKNNSSVQHINSISTNGYTNGEFCIYIDSDWDYAVRQRFIEALNNNDINQETPGVRVFPGTSPILRVRVTTENIDDILEKIFRVTDVFEGENSINDAMKEEIFQSLQQFISPAPRI